MPRRKGSRHIGSKFEPPAEVEAEAVRRAEDWQAHKDAAGDKFLSPVDHVSMVVADKDAAVAALELERDVAKLQAFRLQTAAQIEQAEQSLREKRIHMQVMANARRDLAAQIADRYAVNWETHVLEPITGRLMEAPRD